METNEPTCFQRIGMNQTILITGCCGSLGRKVVKTCLDQGFTVLGIDKQYVKGSIESSHQRLGVFAFFSWDISFPASLGLLDLIKKMAIESCLISVIHCAAVIDTSLSSPDCFRVNERGTLHILDLMHASQIKRIIYVSSNQSSFEQKFLYSWLRTPYSKSKQAAEQVIQTFSQNPKADIEFRIVRPGLIYGSGDAFYWKLQRSSQLLFKFRCGNSVMWEGNQIDDLASNLVYQASTDRLIEGVFDIGTPIKAFDHWNQRLVQDNLAPFTIPLPWLIWLIIGVFWEIVLGIHLVKDYISLLYLWLIIHLELEWFHLVGVCFWMALSLKISRQTLQGNFLYLSLADSIKLYTSHAQDSTKIIKKKPRKDD
jgi:nucleoside-diphosphate-sugar epimerase